MAPRVCVAILSWAILAGCTTGVQQSTQASVDEAIPTPSVAVVETVQSGFVEDEQAAVEIALKTWLPVYGKKMLEQEKPFVAALENGVWHVHGSVPENWVGGVAEAWIDQKDGRVLKFTHGK
jgi:hypothetical protein